MNTIWLIFRNVFPVMHHLPNIWLRNIAQTDLYVLDVAPGTWYLSKRRFPDALLYDFKLYGQIFIIILIVLISKNKGFVILLTMEIQIQTGVIADRQTYHRFF